jgi:hypothetical protein
MSGTASSNSIDDYRQLIIDQFQNALIVRPRVGTKLVDVGVRGENSQDVAKQANMAVQVYIRQNLEKKLDIARKAVVWLKIFARGTNSFLLIMKNDKILYYRIFQI